MKIGTCCDWKNREHLKLAKEAGAEFVEFSFSSFADATKEEIASLAAFLKELDLPCLSYNCMLPGTHRVTGKNKDFTAAAKFVDDVMSKLKALDARNVVFGSCDARQLEEGDTRENAYAALKDFIPNYLAPIFRRHGFICAIETLSECNLVHTMDDGLELVLAANLPEIQLQTDFYHVHLNGEDMSKYTLYGPYLRHVHTASPSNKRAVPARGDGDEELYVNDFRILRQVGYDGPVSIESGTAFSDNEEFFAAIKEGIITMREAYAKSAQ